MISNGNKETAAGQESVPLLGVPVRDGFAMPAEWMPHQRCFIAWPCHEGTFGPVGSARRKAAYAAYAEVARAIAQFEPVTMLANSSQVAEASHMCGAEVSVMPIPLTDSWTRDTGPSFLVDGKGRLAGVDWRFNAWGGNYPEHHDDAALAGRLLSSLKLPRYAAPFFMEGGAVHVDGKGTALVTASVLLNPNRNPDLTQQTMERHLHDYLGADTVIWLPGGLEDDETDGHVDNVACFLAPGVVAILDTDDKNDGNYTALKANKAHLAKSKDAQGQLLEIVSLYQPPRQIGLNGRRLALSYINFYFANGGIVMPSFDHPADNDAYKKLQHYCSDRRIIQVPAQAIVEGGGGIHCITQQMPVAEDKKG